jgi:hypothetical protein
MPGDQKLMPYEEPVEKQSGDEALLKEIRDRYKYFSEKWRPIREERRTDLRYICGQPWSDEDLKERKDAGRPAINHDELNQYINQGLNNVRANPRGIKVEPGGNGASDKSAEFRQNLIRGIEYKSQAQGAYTNAFQAELEGSYGFIRIGRRYVSQDIDGPDDQEIVISNIANPDSVLYDPDCKKADWSDPRAVFVLDPLDVDEFKRQYPNARVTDFSEEDRRVAKDWLQDKQVLVAEYWRVEVTRQWNTRHTRQVEKKKVVQYITNGVEILERNPQPGEHIPIIPFLGLERWVDEGAGPVRKLFSLVRLARDPQMSLAYLVSLEMEEGGLTPKTPYLGYVGQFETDKEAWDTATKIPHPYLQVDPIPDSSNGAPLPLPQRVQFTPNFQAYEMAKDSARRAIQSAMGISPLPTSAQRDNQKSGVALEKIQQSTAIGSFHFVDNYERALKFAGRVIDEWIPVVYDTERDVAIRKPDDTQQVVRINTEGPYPHPETNEPQHFPVEDSDHDITISTGPSDDSQRDAVRDFLDTLIGNLGNLPVAPPQAAKLLSLAIQMKQLGPKGDEMAEIISPTDNAQQQIPPQAQAAIAQTQQELQAMHAYAQQQEQKVKELEQERQAKVIDNEYRLRIEQMKIEADLAKAEILTKAQSIEERLQFVEDAWKQLHQQQADQQQQAQDQQHQQQMKAAELAQQQQAQEAAQQHEAGMQSADQAHALDLQQQQAAAAQQQAAQ